MKKILIVEKEDCEAVAMGKVNFVIAFGKKCRTRIISKKSAIQSTLYIDMPPKIGDEVLLAHIRMGFDHFPFHCRVVTKAKITDSQVFIDEHNAAEKARSLFTGKDKAYEDDLIDAIWTEDTEYRFFFLEDCAPHRLEISGY